LTGLQRFADSDITPFAFPESDIASAIFFFFALNKHLALPPVCQFSGKSGKAETVFFFIL
jgi:hypothetical protein